VLREGSTPWSQDDDEEVGEDVGTVTEPLPLLDQYHMKMYDLAKRTARDASAVEKAQALMQEAEQQGLVTVDIGLYNLLWETYAYASHWEDGVSAIEREIQQRLEECDDDAVAKPNLESYAILVEGYAQRGNVEQLENLLDRLENEIGTQYVDLKPDLTIYNKMVWAYGVMRQADKAKELFQRLLSESGALSENDNDNNSQAELRPNANTWARLLRALALDGRVDEVKEHLRLLRQGHQDFGYEDWKVNVNCYNALILALLTDGKNSKEDSIRPNALSQQAEKIVYEMIQAHRDENARADEMRLEYESSEDGSGSVCPNRETFSLLFQCFRGETSVGVAAKIEKLLELQQALADAEPESWSIQADTKMYNVAISVLSRSRDPRKAVRAQRILETMLESVDNEDQRAAMPSLVTYRNIMNACAFTRGSPEENLAAYQVAVQVFNLVREYPATSDSSSDTLHSNMMGNIYHLFIKASFNLMAPTQKRDNVVERIFRKCCQDGYCSNKMLDEIGRRGSDELQLKLLGGFIEDGIQTRPEWSRNVPTP